MVEEREFVKGVGQSSQIHFQMNALASCFFLGKDGIKRKFAGYSQNFKSTKFVIKTFREEKNLVEVFELGQQVVMFARRV